MPSIENPPNHSLTRGRQVAERVHHDFERAAAILDEGLIAHVGFAVDGQSFVLPMAYARVDRELYLHGAGVSRLVQNLAAGLNICVTVTHLDGMVLARSSFGHSMNYRSVMIFGQARLIDDTTAKDEALQALVDFLVPGRNAETRAADSKELNATALLSLPIEQFSVKERAGPPQDPAKDDHVATWTGEIPLRLVAETPIPDPLMKQEHPVPAYARQFIAQRLRRIHGKGRSE